MPRTKRVIFENTAYEIIPRAREGLPLPPTRLTNQLLTGILARTQRDDKVTLCNFVNMNNHDHQHVVPKESDMMVKFYMEYQKKVTDSVRKLTRNARLNLWEGRPAVVMMQGVEDVVRRLVYIFLNPAKAGLVKSIDEYPGLSSWNAFKSCAASVDAEVIIKARWTPASKLKPLPLNNRLSPKADDEMVNYVKSHEDSIEYDLVVKPFAWLKSYGITAPQEIESIRQRVIREVYEAEAAIAKERREKSEGVIGAEKLRRQEYLKSHTPKKKERKVYVFCCDDVVRPQVIKAIKRIDTECDACYKDLKSGLPHEWPPGTFIPWIPPTMCRPKFRPAMF